MTGLMTYLLLEGDPIYDMTACYLGVGRQKSSHEFKCFH